MAHRASPASVPNRHRPFLNSLRSSREKTCAASLMMTILALLQVFLDACGLAHQEGNVLIGDGDEAVEHLHGLLELLDELLMLLVAPAVAEAEQLAVQHRHLVVQPGVELL